MTQRISRYPLRRYRRTARPVQAAIQDVQRRDALAVICQPRKKPLVYNLNWDEDAWLVGGRDLSN